VLQFDREFDLHGVHVNAAVEVDRLLNQSGAVLVRQNKHLVYRLPNGQNFVMAKTSSDPDRAAKNNLRDLRHALGIVRVMPKPKGEPDMPIEQAPGVAAPAQEPPMQESLKDRIEAAIAREETVQEKLLSDAQAVERRVHMLRALLTFADDPAIEAALRAVLPDAEPAAPPTFPPEARPEPPQQITERVQVTRQLVFAATQTFDDTFTVNDVLKLMAGDGRIDPRERIRIRSSIAQSIVTLHERGELVREEEHFGRKQTIWRKAALNGNGNGTGTRA
jgi:hypothetical protein